MLDTRRRDFLRSISLSDGGAGRAIHDDLVEQGARMGSEPSDPACLRACAWFPDPFGGMTRTSAQGRLPRFIVIPAECWLTARRRRPSQHAMVPPLCRPEDTVAWSGATEGIRAMTGFGGCSPRLLMS